MRSRSPDPGAHPPAPAYAYSAPDTLTLRRVYIFLTRHGLMLAGMLAIILLGSINYDNALGYMLAFLLGGLLLIAILHTYRNLAGLTFVGASALPVFAGEDARFELVLDKADDRDHLGLNFHAAWRPGRSSRSVTPLHVLEVDLKAEGLGGGTLRVPTYRRGWLQLDRIRVTSIFPLGMLRAWAYFRTDSACLVYPKADGALPLPLRTTASATATAGTHSGSDDFVGLRPYTLGDPPRTIAWKSLAKDQEMMAKRFVGGGEVRVWLAWDDTAGVGDIERRLSQLARWVVEADAAGAAYGLDLPDTKIPFGTGRGQRDTCLRALALYGTDAQDG